MSNPGTTLGGRLPLAERSALSESQQQLYDHMATRTPSVATSPCCPERN
jgi:hypothetical protein